jgi:hypothetical protein
LDKSLELKAEKFSVERLIDFGLSPKFSIERLILINA